MLFFRSYFFKGSETDLNKLVQKQLALNSTITILEKLQAIRTTQHGISSHQPFLRLKKKNHQGTFVQLLSIIKIDIGGDFGICKGNDLYTYLSSLNIRKSAYIL